MVPEACDLLDDSVNTTQSSYMEIDVLPATQRLLALLFLVHMSYRYYISCDIILYISQDFVISVLLVRVGNVVSRSERTKSTNTLLTQ